MMITGNYVALAQENVTAVLTAKATDVLSHVAIRARSQKVLLATCFEEEELATIRRRDGTLISLSTNADGCIVGHPIDAQVRPISSPPLPQTSRSLSNCIKMQAGEPSSNSKAGANGAVPGKVTVGTVRKSLAWVLKEEQFEEGLVGGKSRSLRAMRGKLPKGIALPVSVALPYGSFERTLQVRGGLLEDIESFPKETQGFFPRTRSTLALRTPSWRL